MGRGKLKIKLTGFCKVPLFQDFYIYVHFKHPIFFKKKITVKYLQCDTQSTVIHDFLRYFFILWQWKEKNKEKTNRIKTKFESINWPVQTRLELAEENIFFFSFYISLDLAEVIDDKPIEAERTKLRRRSQRRNEDLVRKLTISRVRITWKEEDPKEE